MRMATNAGLMESHKADWDLDEASRVLQRPVNNDILIR